VAEQRCCRRGSAFRRRRVARRCVVGALHGGRETRSAGTMDDRWAGNPPVFAVDERGLFRARRCSGRCYRERVLSGQRGQLDQRKAPRCSEIATHRRCIAARNGKAGDRTFGGKSSACASEAAGQPESRRLPWATGCANTSCAAAQSRAQNDRRDGGCANSGWRRLDLEPASSTEGTTCASGGPGFGDTWSNHPVHARLLLNDRRLPLVSARIWKNALGHRRRMLWRWRAIERNLAHQSRALSRSNRAPNSGRFLN